MDTFLPEADRQYLAEKSYVHKEIIDGAQRAVVFTNWKLPIGKFNVDEVELLILIPIGYRDTQLDMFWVSPSLTLKLSGKMAKATEHHQEISGRNWQRWSRHLVGGKWRPGVDGLHTFLQAVQKALEEAKE